MIYRHVSAYEPVRRQYSSCAVFEEWDDSLISGTGCISALVEIAGGIDIFALEIAEACLAHFPHDKTTSAYQRGDRMELQRRVMEAWGRYCSGVALAKVVPFRAQGSVSGVRAAASRWART